MNSVESRFNRPKILTASNVAFLLVLIAIPFFPAITKAGFIITVENSASRPGSTGSFDVTLQNSGTQPISIGGFSVDLFVSGSSGVHFTGASINTAPSTPYIFGTLQSPPLVDPTVFTFPNIKFVASDYTTSESIAANTIVGLEHVTYSVDPTAVGPTVAVMLDSRGTGISDPAGLIIPSTLQGGLISLPSSAVPEPSTLLMTSVGSGLVFLLRHRRRVNLPRSFSGQ